MVKGTDEWLKEWMNQWVNELKNGSRNGWLDQERINRWMVKGIDEWMKQWMILWLDLDFTKKKARTAGFNLLEVP